ncbi:hypothetical protein ATANTOWER_021003 [Ataeniobius toweri]|uniref:Uncharacterized protein n=1 Tax=Ataeniobius toweri TaxID=208326 RepID=A0ABU7CID9_9TELE|nr:hypothetical protein [Ataeniobius toweri]
MSAESTTHTASAMWDSDSITLADATKNNCFTVVKQLLNATTTLNPTKVSPAIYILHPRCTKENYPRSSSQQLLDVVTITVPNKLNKCLHPCVFFFFLKIV